LLLIGVFRALAFGLLVGAKPAAPRTVTLAAIDRFEARDEPKSVILRRAEN
jgi:hypothetical protein